MKKKVLKTERDLFKTLAYKMLRYAREQKVKRKKERLEFEKICEKKNKQITDLQVQLLSKKSN